MGSVPSPKKLKHSSEWSGRRNGGAIPLSKVKFEKLDNEAWVEVAGEITDVKVHLIPLTDNLRVDKLVLVDEKIKKIEVKYRGGKIKGSTRKYTEPDDE